MWSSGQRRSTDCLGPLTTTRSSDWPQHGHRRTRPTPLGLTGATFGLGRRGATPSACIRSSAERHHVDAWMRHLTTTPQPRTGRPSSPATVARKLSAVAGFYEYGIAAEVLAHSPVASVRRPTVSLQSQTVGLTADELRRPGMISMSVLPRVARGRARRRETPARVRRPAVGVRARDGPIVTSDIDRSRPRHGRVAGPACGSVGLGAR